MREASIWIVVLSVVALSACGGDKKEVKDPYLPPEDPKSEPMIGSAPECVNEEEEPVRCEEDDECCKGFVCGIDPELSSRIKHCIYSGR